MMAKVPFAMAGWDETVQPSRATAPRWRSLADDGGGEYVAGEPSTEHEGLELQCAVEQPQ